MSNKITGWYAWLEMGEDYFLNGSYSLSLKGAKKLFVSLIIKGVVFQPNFSFLNCRIFWTLIKALSWTLQLYPDPLLQ